MVFLLTHTHQIGDCEDIKILGIFSTELRAQEVISEYSILPGFCHNLDGFSIDRFELDKKAWEEGFIEKTWSE